MTDQNRLVVIDREGWRKEYPLQKAITHIGSDTRNDIILEDGRGQGVAALHAQLICLTANCQAHRLVNLSEANMLVGAAGEQVLAPRASVNVGNGQTIRIGDFTLVFYGSEAGLLTGGAAGQGRNLGLKVVLPQPRLAPGRTLEGLVTVSNQGDRTGVQFYLDLEGMDPECYSIEPGPLLSSGAEKEVSFRLRHLGHKPLTGEWQIVIRAVAPQAYPGEEATVSQIIQVLPFYRHRLSLIPPAGMALPQPPEQPPAAVEGRRPVESGQTPSWPETGRTPPAEAAPVTLSTDWWTAPVQAERPGQAEGEVIKLKARPPRDADEESPPADREQPGAEKGSASAAPEQAESAGQGLAGWWAPSAQEPAPVEPPTPATEPAIQPVEPAPIEPEVKPTSAGQDWWSPTGALVQTAEPTRTEPPAPAAELVAQPVEPVPVEPELKPQPAEQDWWPPVEAPAKPVEAAPVEAAPAVEVAVQPVEAAPAEETVQPETAPAVEAASGPEVAGQPATPAAAALVQPAATVPPVETAIRPVETAPVTEAASGPLAFVSEFFSKIARVSETLRQFYGKIIPAPPVKTNSLPEVETTVRPVQPVPVPEIQPKAAPVEAVVEPVAAAPVEEAAHPEVVSLEEATFRPKPVPVEAAPVLLEAVQPEAGAGIQPVEAAAMVEVESRSLMAVEPAAGAMDRPVQTAPEEVVQPGTVSAAEVAQPFEAAPAVLEENEQRAGGKPAVEGETKRLLEVEDWWLSADVPARPPAEKPALQLKARPVKNRLESEARARQTTQEWWLPAEIPEPQPGEPPAVEPAAPVVEEIVQPEAEPVEEAPQAVETAPTVEAEASLTQAGEEGWLRPAADRPAVKLKAGPAPPPESLPVVEVEARPRQATQEWWLPAGESELSAAPDQAEESPAGKPQVVKLKAGPARTEEPAARSRPASTPVEDWWAPPEDND